MKTKLTLLMLAMVLMSGYAQGQTAKESKVNISGTFSSLKDGQKVYLGQLKDRKIVRIDSTTAKNGKFVLNHATLKVPSEAYVVMDVAGKDGKMGPAYSVVYLEGKPLTFSATDEAPKADVYGSPANDAQTAMNKAEEAVFTEEVKNLDREYRNPATTKERRQEISKRYEELRVEERMDSIVNKFLNENIGNIFGSTLLYRRYYAMDDARVEQLLSQQCEACKQSEPSKRIAQYLEKRQATRVGKPFIDFAMKTPEGKDVKLSDYVGHGKWVLIDFWASWCGPCRASIPALQELYKTYKDKGFEVVGVSLDRTAEAWKKGIADLKITWPQMSDLKFWQSEGARLYGVNAIPATFLIAPDGKIAGRDLSHDALKAKLAAELK
jgi:peroxiredoxin